MGIRITFASFALEIRFRKIKLFPLEFSERGTVRLPNTLGQTFFHGGFAARTVCPKNAYRQSEGEEGGNDSKGTVAGKCSD